MKALRILLGLYQLVAAIVAVVIMIPQLGSCGVWFAALVFIFCGLSFVSGVIALLSERLGWKLTLINHCTQLIGIFSPLFSFIVTEGIAFRPYVGLIDTSGSWMDARPVVGFLSKAGADFGFAFFRRLEGFPDYALALNLIALAIIIIAAKALKKLRTQSA
jgi:hypothetical protein